MSEPDVASSDPTNLQTTVRREHGRLVLNGRKWFITGAAHPRCRLLIVMCRNEGERETMRHGGHSLVLVPIDAPGVSACATSRSCTTRRSKGIARSCCGRCGCRRATCWAAGARASRSPSRGGARVACTTACARWASASWRWTRLRPRTERRAFGNHFAEQANVQEWIALSRLEIDQARLLVLRAAGGWTSRNRRRTARADRRDQGGRRAAADAGGGPRHAGVRRDGPVARHAARVAVDLGPGAAFHGGPDEVHLRTVARAEFERAKERAAPAPITSRLRSNWRHRPGFADGPFRLNRGVHQRVCGHTNFHNVLPKPS